ncbi:MAG: hypothetical protein A7316_00475 [Candidatus Altiarchaeales archaeon WOR_SM1_86-2]|nr:MAG: hypothetical protein A7316_00475 [Candidatus Altiarchaeales archaeon WOR_SM1_86-2]
MVGLRPARCYKWDSRPYTRVRKDQSKSFITGIPGSKVIHYDMGNASGSYDTIVSLMAKEKIQIRHNALDAARITANRALENELGAKNYHLKINTYPHHVMRENSIASGAGADRVQEGMRRSFGKPLGRAARIAKDQDVLSVRVARGDVKTLDDSTSIKVAKEALKKAGMKLPGEMEIVIKKL